MSRPRASRRAFVPRLSVAVFVSLVALFAGVQQAVSRSTTRETLGLTYPEGRTISVRFLGTSRLPRASGEAKVERKKGMTEIEIELDEMKPASLFGGDYNTYVLWVASPEGHVDNTGEFIIEGNRSKLDVSTPLETFGMFVTAEPHFLVEAPSRFVVMENTEPASAGAIVTLSRIEYEGVQGIYRFENESLEDMREAKGEVRPHLGAARTAVALAEHAGAERFAREELLRARRSLARTEAEFDRGVAGESLMLGAHETIRLAVEAEKLARKAAFESALAEERLARTEKIEALRAAAESAASEAERARIAAEQRALDRAMEARARESAERQAREAEERAERETAARLAAERERLAAEEEASEARKERREARDALEQALRQVAEVQDTARGLIVAVPNVLFDSGSVGLTSEGREKLAKVAGVLLVSDACSLSVEGHTDSVGDDSFNQELSEKRARTVRDYLLFQRIAPERVRARGFGESRPIASNETSDGRQQNRRVEIVIEDGPETASRVESH